MRLSRIGKRWISVLASKWSIFQNTVTINSFSKIIGSFFMGVATTKRKASLKKEINNTMDVTKDALTTEIF